MINDGLENNPLVSRRELSRIHESAFVWALSLTQRDRQAAEDVMQQAYLLIVEGSARFDGRSGLKTWLFAVIRNAARREYRRRLLNRIGLTRVQILDGYADSSPGDAAMAEHNLVDSDAGTIRASIRRLSPRQREVLELVIDAEFTLEETAGILGVSVGSARTHYHRAKQQLRRDLEGQSRE